MTCTMLHSRKVCLNDLNPHLICVLCGGYFVDATTIIECLHSFCKTCIVRYLETSKYCPICDVQVHKTKPLQNIRSDQTLQDIVYKLVPGFFQKEMQLRRQFYAQHPEAPAFSKEDAGEATDSYYFYSSDDQVSLALQYAPLLPHQNSKQQQQQGELGKRYLRCPAAVTVAHLQKLLRAKYDLSSDHQIDICHETAMTPLSDDFSLMDVAYIYQWKRKGPMHLFYSIYEQPSKRRKMEAVLSDTSSKVESNAASLCVNNVITHIEEKVALRPCVVDEVGEEWKEVQLQISETGIMKVDAPRLLSKEIIISSGRIDSPSPSKQTEPENAKREVNVEPQEISKPKVEKSDINGNKKDVDLNATKFSSCASTSVSVAPMRKAPSSSNLSVASKKAKIEVPKDKRGASVSSLPLQTKEQVKLHCKEGLREPQPSLPLRSSPTLIVKKSVSTSVGFKTLKYSPKNWNPSFTKGYLTGHSTLSKSTPPVANSKQELELKDTSKPSNVPTSNKAPRFFKERDRPRFLGNPVSGVKPMYQIQSDITPRSSPVTSQAAAATSMIKIDPKTLSPMVTKPPITSHSLNNNHLSCSAASMSSAAGTTTTSSRSKAILKNSTSMLPLPSILHPPPNPLVYNYASLMNAALIRPPLGSPNSPHPYSPFPIPQSMFFAAGNQHPRFAISPPTVQRISSNFHSQMSSPPLLHPASSVPTSTVSTPKVDVTKANGDLKEKCSQQQQIDKSREVAKPQDTAVACLPDSGASSEKTVSNVSMKTTVNSSNLNKSEPQSKDVNRDSNNVHSEDKSKSVPPASPAQHAK